MMSNFSKHNYFLAVFVIIGTGLLAAHPATANASSPVKLVGPLPSKLFITCRSKFSGGETSECKVSVDEGHEDEIKLKVESTNPELIQFIRHEVTLQPNQTHVEVIFNSNPTPIKTTVVIKASLSANSQVKAEQNIYVVPALLRSVTVRNSMIGTLGAKVDCHVELRAPAPTGGIELYLSPLTVSPAINYLTLDLGNPRVLAGQDSLDFAIEYNRLLQNGVKVFRWPLLLSELLSFNTQKRTIEIVVGVEPQNTAVWQVVAGTAIKVTFDVVPLRVTSLVVQPSSISSGGETLATFTLSDSPGSSEKALFTLGAARKVWTVPLGSSCAAPEPTKLTAYDFLPSYAELPLTSGTTTYSFKVCSASDTPAVTTKVTVVMRSGPLDAPVTVQPQ